ncbi:MAG TPA: methylmalonyl-CoA mutase family protein, partial [Deferrisomatales bacterium]|nr:methylmalonyl-CoA mutase family protein [Deferrisomatales bacterium]
MSREGIEKGVRGWQDGMVAKTLSKRPERKPEFLTTSGIEMQRAFTPLDVDSDAYLEQVGLPGEYPFTRGVQPTMYRGRFWTMRQYA